MNNKKLNVAQQFIVEYAVFPQAEKPEYNEYVDKFHSLTKEGNLEIYVQYKVRVNRAGIDRYDYVPLDQLDVYGKIVIKDGQLISVETYPQNMPNDTSILTQQPTVDETLEESISISESYNANLKQEFEEKKIHEAKREKNFFYGKKYSMVKNQIYENAINLLKDKYYSKESSKNK